MRLRPWEITKKQSSTPNASVGTVKKPIAAIASLWLVRNAAHRFAGSGFLGTFLIQRSTVRSETSKPSIFSSPWMRGAPQVRFSETIREDEVAQFHAHTPSTRNSAMPRDPPPVQLESGAMPANDRLWLHDNQRLPPTRPCSSQHHPEPFIRSGKPDLRAPSFKRTKLLPKSKIFQE